MKQYDLCGLGAISTKLFALVPISPLQLSGSTAGSFVFPSAYGSGTVLSSGGIIFYGSEFDVVSVVF